MSRTRSRSQWALQVVAVIVMVTGVSTVVPGCGVGYVVRSAYFQAELLHSRVPIDTVRAREDISDDALRAFDRIADVKAYGKEIGLKATDNYETYADHWDRTIWNLTACPALSFDPVKWRFPIVGTVPYLGFFRRSDADSWAARLEEDGNEVFLRTAGAYSTLGWFRDPVLPGMLKWSDARLANTVLHELVHATVWVKGSVSFNESFANFVGDRASFDYLEARFGVESDVYAEAIQRDEDMHRWNLLLRDLYSELNGVYQDMTTDDDTKRERRSILYASLPLRARDAGFHEPERFIAAAEKGPWNNARLMQYRTYNTKTELFETVYEQHGRDIIAFINAIETITDGTKDPFSALRSAAELKK